MFKRNVGGWDRALRLVVGVALLSQVFIGWETAWGFLGIVPLMTGSFGMCPLYTLLGWNTCKRTT